MLFLADSVFRLNLKFEAVEKTADDRILKISMAYAMQKPIPDDMIPANDIQMIRTKFEKLFPSVTDRNGIDNLEGLTRSIFQKALEKWIDKDVEFLGCVIDSASYQHCFSVFLLCRNEVKVWLKNEHRAGHLVEMFQKCFNCLSTDDINAAVVGRDTFYIIRFQMFYAGK